jgi:hypothetical protein
MGTISPRTKDQAQRHNIFCTRCTVTQRVCDVIIDGGNGENIVSKGIVSKFRLTTERHLESYKIKWIKQGVETLVIEQCCFTFSIGKQYSYNIPSPKGLGLLIIFLTCKDSIRFIN